MPGLKTTGSTEMVQKIMTLTSGIKKVLHYLYLTTVAIAAAGILMIIIITLMQIVSRYFSGQSFVWVEELSRYLLILATMSGVTAVCAKGDMIKIEYLLGRINNHTFSRIIKLLIDSLSAIMLYYVAKESVVTVELNETIISTSMRFPLSYIYMIIYYGAILLIAVYALRIILDISEWRKR